MSQTGCYDLDGKCTVCGQYAPCDCEIVSLGEQEVSHREDEDKGCW
jgi:hypothetical protein